MEKAPVKIMSAFSRGD